MQIQYLTCIQQSKDRLFGAFQKSGFQLSSTQTNLDNEKQFESCLPLEGKITRSLLTRVKHYVIFKTYSPFSVLCNVFHFILFMPSSQSQLLAITWASSCSFLADIFQKCFAFFLGLRKSDRLKVTHQALYLRQD